MQTLKPPPPTACTLKPKALKKTKKLVKPKKQKIAQPKILSPLTKSDKLDDPKRKLYDLYENFQNYDRRTDAESKTAEQKQIEVLRDMLVKGFAVKNMNSLHKTFSHPSEKFKSVSNKVLEKGDGNKVCLPNKTLPQPKIKMNSKTGTSVTKKVKAIKKNFMKNV
ncbi:hypothetical protein HHI36_022005 [Cryptolaemus montrouzieri]|uniref:Uncharacterized protein n=1 Tax=Cryptolaemus montrouzieri TaxID=559131 RepID=A0ABD2MYG1_9CUCU